jgi:hypothetical protein
MLGLKTFAAALLAGTLRAAAALAQATGRWTVGTAMPSARTEVAVAEVGGKSTWSASSGASASSKCTILPPTAGAAAPPFRVRFTTRRRLALATSSM